MNFLTLSALRRMIPSNRNPETWLPLLVEVLPRFGIDTPIRVAGFIAQCAHESADFTIQQENLRYSAKRLTEVWASRFRTLATAEKYANNPEKLANFVYGNRMGNGGPDSGDGWRFRGQGIKQLTGRNNYTAWGKTLGMTAEQAAEHIKTPRGSLEAAAWFWQTNRLNAYADADDIVGMSRRINGGNVGLADRTRRFQAAKEILGASVRPPRARATLKRGSSGEDVKTLQKFLGFEGAAIDGDFGPATQRTLILWQTRNNVNADGDMDPEEFQKYVIPNMR